MICWRKPYDFALPSPSGQMLNFQIDDDITCCLCSRDTESCALSYSMEVGGDLHSNDVNNVFCVFVNV